MVAAVTCHSPANHRAGQPRPSGQTRRENDVDKRPAAIGGSPNDRSSEAANGARRALDDCLAVAALTVLRFQHSSEEDGGGSDAAHAHKLVEGCMSSIETGTVEMSCQFCLCGSVYAQAIAGRRRPLLTIGSSLAMLFFGRLGLEATRKGWS